MPLRASAAARASRVEQSPLLDSIKNEGKNQGYTDVPSIEIIESS